jgi:4-amino-4-deoxy-L-arabinose transferase-like glycosyltransferase
MTVLRSWKSRLPEIGLLLLGVSLRLAAIRNVDTEWGYDPDAHYEYAQWFTTHWKAPPLDGLFHAFHPPLYYLIGGLILRAGGHAAALRFFSILLGCARLALLWLGLELYLPGRRMARLVALALAAVLPVAYFMDVTLGGEGLQNLLSVIALLLAPRALRAEGGRRWTLAATLGLMLGLCMLTKISAVALFGAIGLAMLAQFVWEHRAVAERFRRAAPFVLTLVVAFALWSPVLVRNVRAAHTPFPSSFDLSEAKWLDSVKDKPPLDRRSLGYVFLWSLDIYQRPFWPAAIEPQPRFFPVLLAGTFGDYLNYGYAPRRPEKPGDITSNSRAVRRETLIPARLSVIGGTPIALATLGCWLACLAALWRRREAARLPLLLAPPLAIAGLLYFTIKYPFDNLGVIKSAYAQFGCAPLYGLFGLAVEFLWSRGWGGRGLAGIALVGLGLVAFYSLFCRLLPL